LRKLKPNFRKHTIKLWDVAARHKIATLSGDTWAVRSVTYSPDGKTLASGSYINTIGLYFAATNEDVARQRNK
jgi:WD40 repeat protein